MRRLSVIISMLFLSSCSTASPPATYKISLPIKEFKEHFHETIGLVISYKKPNSISFSPQSLKPLTRNFLDAIHKPARIQKKQPLQSLFTKNQGHERYIKFYLPTKLQSIIHKLNKETSFSFEVISKRGRQLYECTQIIIKEKIEKAELLEVHLSINDIGAPLSPSETIQFKLPIGKKEQILIPASAVFKDAFAPFVYLENEQGKVTKQKVKIAGSHGDMIAIDEGLQNNSKIVVPD